MSKECKMCGECCKYIPLPINITRRDKNAVEYYAARGIAIDLEQKFLLIPSRCRHLTEDNKCGIHDHKPHICKEYHGKKRGTGRTQFYIPPGCAMK